MKFSYVTDGGMNAAEQLVTEVCRSGVARMVQIRVKDWSIPAVQAKTIFNQW